MIPVLCSAGGAILKLFAKFDNFLPALLFDDLFDMLVEELCVRFFSGLEDKRLVFVSKLGGLRVGEREFATDVGAVDGVVLKDRPEKNELDRDAVGVDWTVSG